MNASPFNIDEKLLCPAELGGRVQNRQYVVKGEVSQTNCPPLASDMTVTQFQAQINLPRFLFSPLCHIANLSSTESQQKTHKSVFVHIHPHTVANIELVGIK